MILFIFSIWQLNSFNKSYWLSSHDGIFHVIRIREFNHEFSLGQFPVRWTNRLDNNFGLPVFNYIYPGPYLLSLIPMSLGISDINSFKIILFIGYFAGVLGYYFLLKRKNNYFAFISALIYGLTPYLFLNIFVRGALGEIVAMGFMPWVLFFFINKKRFFSSLSLAFVLISHNFLGILFIFFLILYLIINKIFNRFSFISLLLAILISSFFLGPMILEKQFISSGASNSFTFNYQDHFLYMKQLFYGKWDYWYSNPGPKDGMSFQVGFANIIILIIAFFNIFIFKKISLIYKFLLMTVFFSLFLTLNYSNLFWQILKPLQIIQFPWRFLFISTILVPVLFFESFLIIYKKKASISIILSILIVFIAFYNTRNYKRPMEFQNKNQYQSLLNIYNNKTTTTARGEISPKWSEKEKNDGGKILFNNSSISLNTDQSFTLSNLSGPTKISILKNYFPGWQLKDISSRKSITINADTNGNIITLLNNGSYKLFYNGTFVQHFFNYISLISFTYLLISFIIKTTNKKNKI